MLTRVLNSSLLDELSGRYDRTTALSYLNGLSMLSNTMSNIGQRVDILNNADIDGLETDEAILRKITPLKKDNAHCEVIMNEFLNEISETVEGVSPSLMASMQDAGWLALKPGALRFLTKKGAMGYLPEAGPDVFRPKLRSLGGLREQAIVSLSCLEEIFTRRGSTYKRWDATKENSPGWTSPGTCADTDFSYNLVSSTGSLFYRPSSSPSAYNRLKAHAMLALLVEHELGVNRVQKIKKNLWKDVLAWKDAFKKGSTGDHLPKKLYGACDVVSCRRYFNELESRVVDVVDSVMLRNGKTERAMSDELRRSFAKILCSHNTFVRMQHSKPDYTTYEWKLTYAGDLKNEGTSLEYGKERSVKACNAFSNMILLPSFLRMKEWLYEDELQGKASGAKSLEIIKERLEDKSVNRSGIDFSGIFSSDFSRYDDTVTLTLSCFTLANLILCDIITTDAQLYAYLASFSGTILFAPNVGGHLHAADSVFYFDKQGGTASGFKLTSHVGSFMNWELQKFSAAEQGLLNPEDIVRLEEVGHEAGLRMIGINWASTFSADDNLSFASGKILTKLPSITESMEAKGMAVKPAYDPQYLSIMYMTPSIAKSFVGSRLGKEVSSDDESKSHFSPNVMRRIMQACRPENPHELYSYSMLSAFDTILSLQMGLNLEYAAAADLFVKYIRVVALSEVPSVTLIYDGGVRLSRMLELLEKTGDEDSNQAIQYLLALTKLRAGTDRGLGYNSIELSDQFLKNMYVHQARLQIARLTERLPDLSVGEKVDYLALIVNADLTAAMIYNPEQNSETIRNLSRVMGGETAFGSVERTISTISEGQSLADDNGLANSYRKWLSRRVKAAKYLCKWMASEASLEDVSDYLDDLLLEGKHSKWNRAMASLLNPQDRANFMDLLHRFLIS